MAKKVKETPLTSRLKKQFAPKATAPVESQTSEPVSAETREHKTSVLTPQYLTKPTGQATLAIRKCQCALPIELHRRLPSVQKSASPFLSLLSVANLIELMYCEIVNSATLLGRFTKSKPPTRVPSDRHDYWQSTSANVPIVVDEYLRATLNTSSPKALSHFLAWIVSDWDYIKTKIGYHGPKSA